MHAPYVPLIPISLNMLGNRGCLLPNQPFTGNKSGFRSYSNFNRVFTQRMGKTVITWMQDGK